VSLFKGDGIPLALLYRVDATSASWACYCVNTLQLASVASISSAINTTLVVLQTLKQTTQYNKYCIWILKPKIQVKFNMALLETYRPWIILESWYYITRPITLHRIVFIWCKLLVTLHPSIYECFCISRLNRSNHKCKVFIVLPLGLHIERDGPTPHVIMPRSQRMWLDVNLTNAGLNTSGVYYKST